MSEILKLGDVAIGLNGGGEFTGVAHDGTLSGNGLTSSPLGVIGGGGDTSQCLPKSASADFILTSQSSQFITSTAGCQPSGDYAFNSSLSGYLPASASGDFITSTAGLQPSGDYAYNSALSSYLPKSESGDFAPSGDYAYNSALSAYAYESSVSAWTAKQDALTFGYSGSYISSINGSALVDMDTYNVLTAISSVVANNSATWNGISSLSGLTSISANKYTLSAGAGISITNDTANNITIIATA